MSVLIVVAILIVIILISIAGGYLTIKNVNYVNPRHMFFVGFWGTLITLLILWPVSAAITMGVRSGAREEASYTASDVLKAQGIDPAQLPFMLGRAITGSQGEIHGQEDLFTFSIDGSSQPASALRLGITGKGFKQIVDIPYTQIKFLEQSQVTSSASVIMDKNVIATALADKECSGNFWSYTARCWNTEHPTVQKSDKWSDLQITGPGPVLQEHLTSISLPVTWEQYQSYLKGNGVTK